MLQSREGPRIVHDIACLHADLVLPRLFSFLCQCRDPVMEAATVEIILTISATAEFMPELILSIFSAASRSSQHSHDSPFPGHAFFLLTQILHRDPVTTAAFVEAMDAAIAVEGPNSSVCRWVVQALPQPKTAASASEILIAFFSLGPRNLLNAFGEAAMQQAASALSSARGGGSTLISIQLLQCLLESGARPFDGVKLLLPSANASSLQGM